MKDNIEYNIFLALGTMEESIRQMASVMKDIQEILKKQQNVIYALSERVTYLEEKSMRY
jgi:hypothetical protein